MYEKTECAALDVTKPYKFIGFGALDVTKPYQFIGFGALDVTKPYKFIGFGAESSTPNIISREPGRAAPRTGLICRATRTCLKSRCKLLPEDLAAPRAKIKL
jgi:hypothetical protein